MTGCVTIRECRACRSTQLEEVLAFGDMAVADGLLPDLNGIANENKFPLTLAFCPNCALVQIMESVAPEILFGRDYPYYSSFSAQWLEHNRRNAEELIASHSLNQKSLVVELASNDGYLLKNFAEADIPTLGIDPAPGPVAAARELGIEVIEDFFTRDLARKLRAQGKWADVVIANNVLAHVPDLTGFAAGIGHLLKPDGVAVIECAYVRDLVDHCEFDTIYHQHHCYFSATSYQNLFRSVGLYLNDARRLPTHGGSLRIQVGHRRDPTSRLVQLLEEERKLGMQKIDYYRNFADRVTEAKSDLKSLVVDLKRKGHSIAAYAASAKGTTLLNAAGINNQLIDFVVDRNIHKHGRYMPGVHIPICAPERLAEQRPDYAILLAWNFKDEILQQQQAYRDAGGQFIVPIPSPHVI